MDENWELALLTREGKRIKKIVLMWGIRELGRANDFGDTQDVILVLEMLS